MTKQRPRRLLGRTIFFDPNDAIYVKKPDDTKHTYVKINSGKLYITVNYKEGNPYEVFVKLGKGSEQIKACCSALGILITMILQESDISYRRVIKKLKYIKADNPEWNDGELFESIPDAIAKVLEGWRPQNEKQA